MSLNIICAGHLVRYPMGGFCWHHLQYLIGLQRLGHRVTYIEHHGWPDSCYNPDKDCMTDNPAYGIRFLLNLLKPYDLEDQWCYIETDDVAHNLSSAEVADRCRESDLLLNLSNVNWIPQFDLCRRRVLIDTDPVFTQIGGFGLGGPWSRYQRLFTYGENMHRPGGDMPTGGAQWLATRQPIVLDLWPVEASASDRSFTTVMNWHAYGDREYEGRVFGQKSRSFKPYLDLPRRVAPSMELAINAPERVRQDLAEAGWKVADPRRVTSTPDVYKKYLHDSLAEFSVAKHAYVETQSGWFSDRSATYLAMGRPVVLEDTGFSENLPCGEGLMAFRSPDEAIAAIADVLSDPERHGKAARRLAESYFDANEILGHLLEQAL